PGIQTGDIQPDRPPFVTLRLDPCGLKEPSERDIESFSLVREPRQQVGEADVVLHEDRIPEAARGAERDARRFPFYDLLAPQVVVRGLDPGVPLTIRARPPQVRSRLRRPWGVWSPDLHPGRLVRQPSTRRGPPPRRGGRQLRARPAVHRLASLSSSSISTLAANRRRSRRGGRCLRSDG